MSGIFISSEHLSAASPEDQAAVLRVAGIVSNHDQDESTPWEGLAILSDSQWRAFLKGVHPKTRKVLVAIAKSDAKFTWGDFQEELGEDPNEYSGVWGGMTKRTRTVTGEELPLISWDWNADEPNDSYGIMPPHSHQALRRVLLKEEAGEH